MLQSRKRLIQLPILTIFNKLRFLLPEVMERKNDVSFSVSN